MSRQTIVFLIVPTVWSALWLRAGVIPGRWEKVEALTPGTQIVVRLESGERFEGSFQASDPDSISIRGIRGDQILPKDSVERINLLTKRHDSPWNGILIGAAGGGAFVATITAPDDIDFNVGGLLVFMGLGAGIGAVIDASVKKQDLLYKAP